MTDAHRDIARWRMEKAREALEAATMLKDAGSYRGALNRAYYAAFYSARALLATRELDSSKHSGVIALFNREFVKTGLVDKESARLLQRLFRARQEGDYADLVEVTEEQAQQALTDADQFVS